MKRRAFSLLELIIAVAILALSVALVFPRGNRTKDRLSTEMVAKELVSRLRQTRQAALARRVPVALAIPRGPDNYSDTAYTVEGDYKPGPPGKVWKIEQDAVRVVFFVGRWGGPSWTSLPPSPLFQDWWGGSSDAYYFAFTPQGKLESNAESGDGAFRILVAQGLTEAGGTLQQADSAWTVWLRADGEVGLDRGIWNADQAYASSLRDSAGAAQLVTSPVANRDPGGVKVIALPDNKNPNLAVKGNLMDCTSCLTLEVRAKDEDGDPPFFSWQTTAIGEVDASGTVTPLAASPADEGRFASVGPTRMEWSARDREWVGRTSWTPAPRDRGGRAYQLQCKIDDLRGGIYRADFPIDGGWLQTNRESWVLYKARNQNNHLELWKMTLQAKEHQRVVGIPGQDIVFGQWTADGDELVLATSNGIYRANGDGTGLRLVCNVAAPPVDSCCLSADGQYLFYVNGGRDAKEHHRIDLSATGAETDVVLNSNQAIDYVYNLSAANYGHRVVMLENFYRTNRVGFTVHHFEGALVTDGQTAHSDTGVGPGLGSLGGLGQSRTTTGGASLSQDGSEVLWASGGTIFSAPVSFSESAPVSSFSLGASRSFFSGLAGADTHHPRYTYDKKGVVFAVGRGNASRIWYLPDVNDPSQVRELTLPPENLSGDEPTLARPR